ncbi:MAG TPA: hypothetical protein VIM59_17730 [Cellvibrio sp.]
MSNYEQERKELNFATLVKQEFLFLHDFGFIEIESLPTIVRYKNNEVEVHIYHGRQSYEIGLEFIYKDTSYPLSEFIRVVAPELAQQYRNPSATEQQSVSRMLSKIAELTKKYCLLGLEGNAEFFAILERNRSLWREEYAFQTKAYQLRAKANEAFHNKNYSKAFELFKEIKSCLNPSELKKMEMSWRKIKSE